MGVVYLYHRGVAGVERKLDSYQGLEERRIRSRSGQDLDRLQPLNKALAKRMES